MAILMQHRMSPWLNAFNIFSNREEKNKGKKYLVKMKSLFTKIQFSSHFQYWLLSLRLKKAFLQTDTHTHTPPLSFIQMWISAFDNHLLRVISEIHWSEGKTFPHLRLPSDQVHTDVLIIGNKLPSNTTEAKPQIDVFTGRKRGQRKRKTDRIEGTQWFHTGYWQHSVLSCCNTVHLKKIIKHFI